MANKTKNEFLVEIHSGEIAIVHEMDGPDACFEELFGSLCGHSKGKGTISVLIEKLKENNLLFPSPAPGVDYIKAGVKSGIHKKGYVYFFVYLDEDGIISVARVSVFYNGFVRVDVFDLSYNYKWFASGTLRFVVPATKILESQN
ncbi:MAG: hypothetical protein ACI9AR_000531 [Flavobacteriaceae bacterium]|jgi:hypothetical protein